MCRREIPPGYLENPSLLQPLPSFSKSPADTFEAEDSLPQQPQWFYEGRNGWWEYDERTTAELEEAYKESLNVVADEGEQVDSGSSPQHGNETTSKSCELLIAGFLYVIDFEHMIQYRRNEPQRRRRVKRDVRDQIENRKGVAGLRIHSSVTAISQASSLPNNPSNAAVSDASSVATSQIPSHDDSQQDEVDDGVRSLTDRIGVIQLQDSVSANNTQRQLSSSNNSDLPIQYVQHIRERDQPSATRRSNANQPSPISSHSQSHRNLGNVRALNQSLPQSSSLERNDLHPRSSRANPRDDTTEPDF